MGKNNVQGNDDLNLSQAINNNIQTVIKKFVVKQKKFLKSMYNFHGIKKNRRSRAYKHFSFMEKDFVCPFHNCKSKFSRKEYLLHHIVHGKKHTNDLINLPDYKSKLYPKNAFLQFSDIHKHESVKGTTVSYTINKYHCLYCSKTCTTIGKLKQHLRFKHPGQAIEDKYEMYTENVGFSKQAILNKTLKYVHDLDNLKIEDIKDPSRCSTLATLKTTTTITKNCFWILHQLDVILKTSNLFKSFNTGILEIFTLLFANVDHDHLIKLLQLILNNNEHVINTIISLLPMVLSNNRITPEDIIVTKNDLMISNNSWNILWQTLFKNKFIGSFIPGITEVIGKSDVIKATVDNTLQMKEIMKPNTSGLSIPLKRITQIMFDLAVKFSKKANSEFFEDNNTIVDIKISFDGLQKHNSLNLITGAIVGMNLDYQIQSVHNVFPFLLAKGKENKDIYNELFEDIVKELDEIISNGIESTLLKKPIRTNLYFVCDLKALWCLVEDLKWENNSDKQFCPYCLCTSKLTKDIINHFEVWTSLSNRRNEWGINHKCTIPMLTPLNFVFCSLHCPIRICEKLLKETATLCIGQKNFKSKLENLNDFFVQCLKSSFKLAFVNAKHQGKQVGQRNTSKLSKGNSLQGDCISTLLKDATIETLMNIIFEGVNIKDKACNKQKTDLTNLWKTWGNIVPYLLQMNVSDNAMHSDRCIAYLKEQIKLLFFNYRSCFPGTGLSCYLHVLCHCPDLLKDKNIRDIAKFANQNVESHVKDIKKIIDHQTSRGGGLTSKKISKPLQLLEQYFEKSLTNKLLWLYSDAYSVTVPPTYLGCFVKVKHPVGILVREKHKSRKPKDEVKHCLCKNNLGSK